MKQGGFYINNFKKDNSIDECEYRLYKVKNLEASIYLEYPIPFKLKD